MGMQRAPKTATALTVAGSDSGGGAGIQADLKSFAAIGVHGTSVITCLTAQNPCAVMGVHAAPPAFVVRQLEAVFAELPPAALKTGMLYSAGIIRAVARFLDRYPKVPVVVDPVMVATSGARLLEPSAVQALRSRLLPRAALITPNLDEASLLLGHQLESLADLHEAAVRLHATFGVPILVKGGHLRTGLATDVLFDGRTEWVLTAPRIRGRTTHGTGCTYAAAITAYMALGLALPSAVELAKRHVTAAIAQSQRVGAHQVLNAFWRE